MRNETCDKCRFWGFDKEVYESGGTSGTCRRYAPRAVVLPVEQADDFDYIEFPVWPLTLADEWCGEYQPAAVPPGSAG